MPPKRQFLLQQKIVLRNLSHEKDKYAPPKAQLLIRPCIGHTLLLSIADFSQSLDALDLFYFEPKVILKLFSSTKGT